MYLITFDSYFVFYSIYSIQFMLYYAMLWYIFIFKKCTHPIHPRRFFHRTWKWWFGRSAGYSQVPCWPSRGVFTSSQHDSDDRSLPQCRSSFGNPQSFSSCVWGGVAASRGHGCGGGTWHVEPQIWVHTHGFGVKKPLFLETHIYVPRTQMGPLVLIEKDLVLEGWPSKIEVIWALGIYTLYIRYTHTYTHTHIQYTHTLSLDISLSMMIKILSQSWPPWKRCSQWLLVDWFTIHVIFWSPSQKDGVVICTIFLKDDTVVFVLLSQISHSVLVDVHGFCLFVLGSQT